MNLTPDIITTHPGARVIFTPDFDVSSLQNPEVLVYYPGRQQENATIAQNLQTFSWVVPPGAGTFTVNFLLSYTGGESWGTVVVTVDPAQSPEQTISASIDNPLGNVYLDLYDPVGNLALSTQLTLSPSGNYVYDYRPGADWLVGEYKAYIRDDSGVKDVQSIWTYKPSFASMTNYFSLPNWQRQVVEYIKYEMMADSDPMPPGAFLTLEQYATHWRQVVSEVNNIPPYTNFQPAAVPIFWDNVMMKGTLCRVFHSLSNRGVSIPRWQGLNVPWQDESHYEQSWGNRYNALRPEYTEERAYLKGRHLPHATITIDPHLSLFSGGHSIVGTTGLALLGTPTWFNGRF